MDQFKTINKRGLMEEEGGQILRVFLEKALKQNFLAYHKCHCLDPLNHSHEKAEITRQ